VGRVWARESIGVGKQKVKCLVVVWKSGWGMRVVISCCAPKTACCTLWLLRQGVEDHVVGKEVGGRDVC
jgi:hypothetical protein